MTLKASKATIQKWQQDTLRRAIERRKAKTDTASSKLSLGRQGLTRGKGKGIKRKASTTVKDAQWSRSVKDRDGYRCQWPGCGKFDKHNDAHHIAPRSARPDLRYVVENGVTLDRFHHNYVHGAGRQQSIALGFLNLETYEKARKVAT